MPTSPSPRCSDPQCGEVATHRGRCETHQRKAWENASQHTKQMDRSKEYVWRKQVKAKTNGRCAACGQPGAIADHTVPVAEGGARYDPDNGNYLCTQHDAEKTKEDLARMAAARRRMNAIHRLNG